MKTPTLLVLILFLLFPNKLYATYFKHLDELSHKVEPFLGSEINMIREDSAGNIFLKAEGALIRYDIKKETFHQIRPAKVRAIASWVGSYYGGVSYFNLEITNGCGAFVAENGQIFIGGVISRPWNIEKEKQMGTQKKNN